jgi:hypothetical protein
VALTLTNADSLSKWDTESNKCASNTTNFSYGHMCYADISFALVNYILRSIDY